MGKAGTKSAKHARPFAAEREVARAIASEPAAARPITKRRIALAACCGTALLAALATMPARDAATSASQVAAAKPAPAIRTSHPTADAWASVRIDDTTGAISKKKKKSSKTKYMKAAEETDSVGAWFKKVFGSDDKPAARRHTSAID